jgi:hypothetical protein
MWDVSNDMHISPCARLIVLEDPIAGECSVLRILFFEQILVFCHRMIIYDYTKKKRLESLF